MSSCPVCIDGTFLDRNDKLQECEVCHGTSHVMPGEICRCGRSINFEMGGIDYCGRQACYQALASSRP